MRLHWSIALLVILGRPLAAQVGVVVNGRVEDASTRDPVAGARVLAMDSSSVVLTDSVGRFAILISHDLPLSVYVEQFGYRSEQFDLDERAPRSLSVLLLEPAPIELPEIQVVEESALSKVFRDLRGRRNAYQGSVFAFDRTRLERYGGGSAYDFVRMRAPRVYECSTGLSGLCMRGRARTIQDPYPEVPVLICVDGWTSWGAVGELVSLDMQSVSLIEIYSQGLGGIRIYTAAYLTHSARTGRNIALPLGFGC
jgi:hypothetical protein